MPAPSILLPDPELPYRPAILDRIEHFLAIMPTGGFPHENGNTMTLVRRYRILLDVSTEWMIDQDESLVTVRLLLARILFVAHVFAVDYYA